MCEFKKKIKRNNENTFRLRNNKKKKEKVNLKYRTNFTWWILGRGYKGKTL